jgi:hypothetical protein
MDVKFIVFVDRPNTLDQSKIVKTFHDLGYATFVDAIHKNDYDWLIKNVVVGKLFIYDGDIVYMFEKEKLSCDMKFNPDFIVLFHNDAVVTEEDWASIHQYIQQHLTDQVIDMTNTMKVHQLLGKPTTQKAELEPVSMVRAQNDHYHFENMYLDEEDIMLYQVLKPFTDLPYTSVTRNFSVKGHVPFFTDLFICQSWGVARTDIAFLKQMWDHLKMDGEFDMEKLMKAATEKCYPSETNIPEPEPEVYRRKLTDVVKILQEKKSRIIPDFITHQLKNEDVEPQC